MSTPLDAKDAAGTQGPQAGAIVNADFETGNLNAWKGWATRRAEISTVAQAGKYAVALGPSKGMAMQYMKIRPNSRYRLSAWVKTESGADQVELQVSDYGGPKMSVASASTEYRELSLEFTSARATDKLTILLVYPSGMARGYADSLRLDYLGEAPEPKIQDFVEPAIPPQVSDLGAKTQPQEVMDDWLDARFGMFIHWGVYAAVTERFKGTEWVMHNQAMSPEEYRAVAENKETGFTAAKFDPAKWADLAKKAGMEYMVLTTRHHDGYALFDSKHPNSWTSVQQLGRDLIKEYTDAVRKAGLRVGLYYSPMSWRYPGYYNVTGDEMKPNKWGYTSEPWHKENARLMKEEVSEQLSVLLANYGPIEYMFWDGGWLAQQGTNVDAAPFCDSGMYQDPNSQWLVGEKFVEKEESTGKRLGVMGLVRKHQPQMIVNERFGWVGDVHGEEGGAATSGNIRSERHMEKCMSVQKGGWGYVPNAGVVSFEQVAVYLSDCAVRNMNLLLNVAPDREGVIPQNQQDVLIRTGEWLKRVGPAIKKTRGGPWQPQHGEFGFTYEGNNIYCHVYKDYRNRDTGTFTTQSIGNKQVAKVTDLYSGKELPWKKNEDNTITIDKVDYDQTPYVTILHVALTEDVYAKK